MTFKADIIQKQKQICNFPTIKILMRGRNQIFVDRISATTLKPSVGVKIEDTKPVATEI